MGLMVHSLEGIPKEHHRDYFIYLLDYGWQEPLSEIMMKNFGIMASLASKQKNAVVIMKADVGVHFSDEVFSWHSINGEDVDKNDLLPAILVTNRHPAAFRDRNLNQQSEVESDLKMILFPLKKHCKETGDVISLIQRIFNKINNGEDLDNFEVTQENKKGLGKAVIDSIILEPNFAGIGFSFNRLSQYFKKK